MQRAVAIKKIYMQTLLKANRMRFLIFFITLQTIKSRIFNTTRNNGIH